MLSAAPIARADYYDCSRDENGAWILDGLPGGQNLVVNGDFEAPTANGRFYEIVSVGRRWGSWTVGGTGSVDVARLWEHASGNQSIDLNGTSGMGSVSQMLNTVAGKTYLLRFAMSGNGYAQNEPAVKTMQVWWDGALLDTLSFDTTGHTLDDMGWVYYTYQLPAATRWSTELKFASTTPVSFYGPALDDVKVLDPDAAVNVLVNDGVGNVASLSALLVQGPSHGTLTLHDDGTFAYVPQAGFSGVDTFTYRASDGQLQSDPATVTISVISTNDPPTAENDSYQFDEDALLVVESAAGLLNNDSDPNGDSLSAVLAEGPLHGTLDLNDDGTFSYLPDADFNGTDTFTYRTGDGQSQSNLATVTITVNPVNDVRGTVFEDVNENGTRDEGERGLEGYTVYADQNGNGVLDQGEVAVLTGADGLYSFAGLLPGEYTIRQVPRENHFPTVPSGRSGFAISVDTGDLGSGLDFGNLIVAAESMTHLPTAFSPGMLHGLDATGGDLWFSFVADRDGRIMIRANSAGVQFTLYDAEGYEVPTASDGRGNPELLYQPVTEGQVFYLRISIAESVHRKVNVSLHVLPPAGRGHESLESEHDRRGARTAAETRPVAPIAGRPSVSGLALRARIFDAVHTQAEIARTCEGKGGNRSAETGQYGERSFKALAARARLFDLVHGSARPVSVGPF